MTLDAEERTGKGKNQKREMSRPAMPAALWVVYPLNHKTGVFPRLLLRAAGLGMATRQCLSPLLQYEQHP